MLKPEISLGLGAAVAALVVGVYMNATPSFAEIRVTPPGNRDVQSSRKAAAWTSAAVVSGVSLLAKDPTIFVIGAGMVVVLDWWTRHADSVHPTLGRATPAEPAVTQEADPGGYGYSDDLVSVY